MSEVVIHKGRNALSPSKISNYFYNGCKRSLLFSIWNIGKAIWLYIDENNTYQKFNTIDNIIIDLAYISEEPEVELDHGIINFEENRFSTKDHEYKIIRATWFYKQRDSIDGWIPLNDENSSILDRAHREKHPKAEIRIDGTIVNVDMNNSNAISRNPYVDSDSNYLKQAAFEKGIEFEDRLVKELSNSSVIYGLDGNMTNEQFIDTLLNILEIQDHLSHNRRVFIYQPPLIVPDSFIQELGLKGFNFSTCYPDLLELRSYGNVSKVEIKVIDVKSSQSIQSSYYAQISLYAMILEHILRSNVKLSAHYSISHVGAVWLFNQDDYVDIDLNNTIVMWKHYLKNLLNCPPNEANYNLSSACNGCDYFEYCKTLALREGDFGIIYNSRTDNPPPNLKINYILEQNIAKEPIPRFQSTTTNLISDFELASPSLVTDIYTTRAIQNMHTSNDATCSLYKISLRANAFKNNEVIFLKGPTKIFKEEGTLVFLRLLSGVHFNLISYVIMTYVDGVVQFYFKQSKDIDDRIEPQLIEDLYNILNQSDIISIYTYSKYEKFLLRQTLGTSLSTKSKKLLTTLFNNISNSLNIIPYYASKKSIVCIQKELDRLVLMPLTIDANFKDICKLLISQNTDDILVDDKDIIKKWHKNNTECVNSDMERLVRQTYLLYKYLLQKNKELNNQVLSPAKFEWKRYLDSPSEASILKYFCSWDKHKGLKRLSENYQSIYYDELSLLSDDVVVVKLRSKEDNLAIFDIVKISDRLLGHKLFYTNAIVPVSDFLFGEPDLIKSSLFQFSQNSIKFINKTNLSISLKSNLQKLEIGGSYLIVEKVYPYTYILIEQVYKEVGSNESLKLFLKNPVEWGRQTLTLKEEVISTAMEIADQMEEFRLTEYQKSLFIKTLRSKLQWILGPPGSGKTFFTSLLLSILGQAHKRLNSEFRVLVTSLTHNAIDNILLKLKDIETLRYKNQNQERLAALRINPDKSLFKGIKTTWINDIYPEKTKVSLLFGVDTTQFVVGSTNYSIYKTDVKYDMIVIDEASQSLLRDAAPLITYLKENGQLIIIGDHNQLPPITSIEKMKHEPLFGSIFDFIRYHDSGSEFQGFLRENWRMNDVIVEVPSKHLYTVNDQPYRPANHAIAQSRFFFKTSDKENPSTLICDDIKFKIEHEELLKLLDGNNPFIVVILKDIHGDSDIVPHDELISCLVNVFRYMYKAKYPEEDDETFWNYRLLVSSPHHAQNSKIRRAMADDKHPWYYKWENSDLCRTETVEKAQGREYDITIFDYCIFDLKTIQKEISFLYNINRINVGLTRSKLKTIVFLSEDLIGIVPGVMEDERYQKAWSYLNSYVNYAKDLNVLITMTTEELKFITHMIKLGDFEQFKDKA